MSLCNLKFAIYAPFLLRTNGNAASLLFSVGRLINKGQGDVREMDSVISGAFERASAC